MYWKKKPQKRTVSIIAAMTDAGVVGNKNTIPWHIPSDLMRFKEETLGKNVIMGSSTYQSVIDILGKPLPKRNTIVLSKKMKLPPFGKVSIARDWSQAFEFAHGQKEIFIIGGPSIWSQAMQMDIVDKMYITTVHADIDGDAYFPEWNDRGWDMPFSTNRKMRHHQKDQYQTSFAIYSRKRN